MHDVVYIMCKFSNGIFLKYTNVKHAYTILQTGLQFSDEVYSNNGLHVCNLKINSRVGKRRLTFTAIFLNNY